MLNVMSEDTGREIELEIPAVFDPLLKPSQRSNHRQGALPVPLKGTPSAKHVLEALGIPHTEVAGLRLDGEWRELGYQPRAGERLAVVPVGAAEASRLDYPGERARFLLDNHLGKLATYLRILGFDCRYEPELPDAALAAAAQDQGLILLTRDRQLLMRREVTYGCWIRSKDPIEQVRQVLDRYTLREQVRLFYRCLRCNQPLAAVSKEQVLERLEPLTKKYYDEFKLCPACKQIYWPGSHYERMQGLIERFLEGREE